MTARTNIFRLQKAPSKGGFLSFVIGYRPCKGPVDLLLADGERYGLIRDKLDCDTNFIARWKSRFVGECLAGPYSRHAGRPPRQGSERQEARILK